MVLLVVLVVVAVLAAGEGLATALVRRPRRGCSVGLTLAQARHTVYRAGDAAGWLLEDGPGDLNMRRRTRFTSLRGPVLSVRFAAPGGDRVEAEAWMSRAGRLWSIPWGGAAVLLRRSRILCALRRAGSSSEAAAGSS
ncbi:hypothetical protein P0W64_09475 [Tsukamurella sp. 8F]|uniref:hypothetical protein n=1 Tax=unclassified Tsukamurella TaxID=2633480 RepID=UPI0023B8CC0F|nr:MULTISPECIES: hypothetical protein [unclassified Tsukamurella]MDF0529809.1 hypothetical protein [Tsukamurella sp. 8J]MDF0587001.1 hypothetical protein [Tsukamurella sp. 8F]